MESTDYIIIIGFILYNYYAIKLIKKFGYIHSREKPYTKKLDL